MILDRHPLKVQTDTGVDILRAELRWKAAGVLRRARVRMFGCPVEIEHLGKRFSLRVWRGDWYLVTVRVA